MPPRARRQLAAATGIVCGRPEPNVQCTLSVVAESRPQNPWVGLMARKERIDPTLNRRSFHLPRHAGRVVIETMRLHLQWRDRAGFTPASPLCPHGHPRQATMLAQDGARRPGTVADCHASRVAAGGPVRRRSDRHPTARTSPISKPRKHESTKPNGSNGAAS